MGNSQTIRRIIAENLPTILALIIVLPLLFSALQAPTSSPFIVEGSSMVPTLEDNQVVGVDKTVETYARGDIIVTMLPEAGLKYTADEQAHFIVKRIIAIPGDTVDIGEDDGVYVNGEKIEEPYLSESAKEDTYVNNFPTHFEMGEGEYFVLGDNRTNSCDSRYFGAVTREEITGLVTDKTLDDLFLLKSIAKHLVLAVGGYLLLEKIFYVLLHRLLKV